MQDFARFSWRKRITVIVISFPDAPVSSVHNQLPRAIFGKLASRFNRLGLSVKN
jgi:hypothetical protein